MFNLKRLYKNQRENVESFYEIKMKLKIGLSDITTSYPCKFIYFLRGHSNEISETFDLPQTFTKTEVVYFKALVSHNNNMT